MPTIPKSNRCAHIGCHNHKATYGGYCSLHGGRDVAKRNERTVRGSKEYMSKWWQRNRMVQLSAQPLCQSCLLRGITTAAEHVDHVWAWQDIGDYAFRLNLFQSLCQPCHSTKTGMEHRGVYRHYGEHGARDYTLRDHERLVMYIEGPNETPSHLAGSRKIAEDSAG